MYSRYIAVRTVCSQDTTTKRFWLESCCMYLVHTFDSADAGPPFFCCSRIRIPSKPCKNNELLTMFTWHGCKNRLLREEDTVVVRYNGVCANSLRHITKLNSHLGMAQVYVPVWYKKLLIVNIEVRSLQWNEDVSFQNCLSKNGAYFFFTPQNPTKTTVLQGCPLLCVRNAKAFKKVRIKSLKRETPFVLLMEENIKAGMGISANSMAIPARSKFMHTFAAMPIAFCSSPQRIWRKSRINAIRMVRPKTGAPFICSLMRTGLKGITVQMEKSLRAIHERE